MSVAGMLVGVLQLGPAVDVLVEIIGEGQLVQRAADDGLRLVPLGDDDAVQAVFAGRRPSSSGP